MVDVELLVPAKVIADRLGFKGVQSVHYFLRSDPDFPEPLFTQPDAARPFRLWYWPDVETWWAVRARRPRRTDPADRALAESRLQAPGRAERPKRRYRSTERNT